MKPAPGDTMITTPTIQIFAMLSRVILLMLGSLAEC